MVLQFPLLHIHMEQIQDLGSAQCEILVTVYQGLLRWQSLAMAFLKIRLA